MDDLPDDIKRFIASNVSSVAQLEVLLLLRQQSDRGWTAAQVAQSLYASAPMMEQLLDELHSSGLLTKETAAGPLFRYAPKSTELAEVASQLDEVYKVRRVAVTTFIHSIPMQKMRTFADAFRLRKEREK